MAQDTKHSDYDKWSSIWERMRDAVEGFDKIKEKSETYLPKLNGQVPDEYSKYKRRAQYVDFPSELLNTAIGQLFRKDPTGLNDVDEVLLENITLAGESFYYTCRDIADEIMQVNRIGIHVDWSEAENRPFWSIYKAENIINWQTQVIDGVVKPVMIMLEGVVTERDDKDPYKVKEKKIWRELYIDEEDGYFKIREWEKTANNNKFFGKSEKFVEIDGSQAMPLMDGKPFDYIPFFPITTDGISWKLDKPPIYGIVNVTLGHYVNSADYENMLHWTGQRTIIAKGWKDGKAFPVGACATFPPEGGADYLEAQSDSELNEAMKRKEEQLAMMGSQRLSGKGRYVASAKTSEITSQGEYATLADVANAMSSAVSVIMQLTHEWMGGKGLVKIGFNTDYDTVDTNAVQDATGMSGLVSMNLMSWKTYFYNMKKREFYQPEWTIEDEEKAIEETLNKQVENREKKMPDLYNLKGDQNGLRTEKTKEAQKTEET